MNWSPRYSYKEASATSTTLEVLVREIVQSPPRERRTWMFIAGLWAAYIALVFLVINTVPAAMNAFEVYYYSAEKLLTDQSVYAGLTGWIYLYPPLLAQLLMPLAAMDNGELANNLWLLFNIGLTIMTIGMLMPYVPRKWHRALWVLPIIFLPFWQALYLGQITIVMFALLAFAWINVKRDQHMVAGALIALAAWIKVFPAVIVIYFLAKRNWRALYGVTAMGIVLFMLQVTVSGPELMIRFFDILFDLTAAGQPEATYESLSIFAFSSRLFEENTRVIPFMVNVELMGIARMGLSLGIVSVAAAVIAWTELRVKSASVRIWRFDLEYSLLIVTILLLGSTLWVSGLPPLFLVYVLLLRNLHRLRHPRLMVAGIVLSVVLITTYQPLVVLFKGALHALSLSSGFFGVMLVWILLAAPLMPSFPRVFQRRVAVQ